MTKINGEVVAPGPTERQVRLADGAIVEVPIDWELLSPGDAALTRRVKAAGDHCIVQEKRGRKTFSHGVWAPAATIAQIRTALLDERAKPGYARKRAADTERRQAVQRQYVGDFESAVHKFLNFASCYEQESLQLAQVVTAHATPVGSGTVARTTRIPIEKRAESAVIAWMRHQTTAYDSMKIARVKGRRREVRVQLAQHSRRLLGIYRRGESIPTTCPLQKALQELARQRPESNHANLPMD